MKIIADTHPHTLVSGHAYSTITENLRYTAQRGLYFLCSTDHTGGMPDAPHYFYFDNQQVIPDQLFGVWLVRGAEVNVVGNDGELDLPRHSLHRLDWVIASMHSPVYPPQDPDAHTQAWLNIAKDPDVDVIGHSGDERYRFDYERCIRAFGEAGKVVEINSHSFAARPGSEKNCREIALLCKKYAVPVVVSSDAHFFTHIGSFDNALKLLEEIDFPEELVLNADYDRFARFLEQKSGRRFQKELLEREETP